MQTHVKDKNEILIDTPLPQAPQVEVKKITRGRSMFRIPTSRVSLALIVLFQGLISLLTLHNTAFQDEALYLLAGRQIFNGWVGLPHVSVPWGYYFSGYPYVYPVIGGVLDMLGGVALARMFSLLCMIGLTLSVYYVTKQLFDQVSAILAAALFASQGTVLFLGQLATYDALCLLFLGLATVLAIRISIARRPWAILGIGPLLTLAFLAKYAALLFAPIPLALLFCYSIERQGWRKMLDRMGLALFSLIVTGVITYLNFDKEALHGLINTTTNRDGIIVVKTSALVLAQHVVTLGGVGLALGLLGLLLVSRRRFPIALALFGAALLAPAYHIYKGELISLHKHIAFSMFFVMPLVGYAVARISDFRPNRALGRYWLAGLAIYLFIFSLGVQQAQSLYSDWPPSNNLTYALKTQVRSGVGRYLAEDFDVSRYYLQNTTSLWQWSSLDFFAYTDKQGHYLVGNAAYHAAIQDGYFDLIELNFGYRADVAGFVYHELSASKKYALVAKVPLSNSYGTGYYWIWRKK
jgi:4-amino-4-deoxy-L-arabinose transferase-like glycosyltransferase